MHLDMDLYSRAHIAVATDYCWDAWSRVAKPFPLALDRSSEAERVLGLDDNPATT